MKNESIIQHSSEFTFFRVYLYLGVGVSSGDLYKQPHRPNSLYHIRMTLFFSTSSWQHGINTWTYFPLKQEILTDTIFFPPKYWLLHQYVNPWLHLGEGAAQNRSDKGIAQHNFGHICKSKRILGSGYWILVSKWILALKWIVRSPTNM